MMEVTPQQIDEYRNQLLIREQLRRQNGYKQAVDRKEARLIKKPKRRKGL